MIVLVQSLFHTTWASLIEMDLEPNSLDWNGNKLEQELELEDMKRTSIYATTTVFAYCCLIFKKTILILSLYDPKNANGISWQNDFKKLVFCHIEKTFCKSSENNLIICTSEKLENQNQMSALASQLKISAFLTPTGSKSKTFLGHLCKQWSK